MQQFRNVQFSITDFKLHIPKTNPKKFGAGKCSRSGYETHGSGKYLQSTVYSVNCQICQPGRVLVLNQTSNPSAQKVAIRKPIKDPPSTKGAFLRFDGHVNQPCRGMMICQPVSAGEYRVSCDDRWLIFRGVINSRTYLRTVKWPREEAFPEGHKLEVRCVIP